MDRVSDIPVESKIRMLAAQLFAAADLGIWCFSPEQKLYLSSCTNQSVFESILAETHCLDKIDAYADGSSVPLILSDDLGLVWVAEHMYDGETKKLLILMGPLFISFSSQKAIDELLRRRYDEIARRREIARALAAVQGGASMHIAMAVERRITAEVEKCQTITQLQNVNQHMITAFIRAVNEARTDVMISKPVRDCCDYIRANVTKPLTAEMIAGQMGYATYYLTKKFNKEMGIKVSSYINQARIEYAKIVLMTSRQSIEDISELLHFGTRNYFSKVFCDVTGLTPAMYRSQMVDRRNKQKNWGNNGYPT